MNEISAENLVEIEKRYRTTVFIVLAQAFVVLILVAVALIGAFQIPNNLSSQDFTTLWIGVLFIAIGSFLLRRLFSNWERLKNIALLKGVSGLLGTLQRNAIILSFPGLLVGIIGFLIACLSGNAFDMIRAAIIAFVVLAVNFPRKGVWKTIVSNVKI